MINYQKIYFLKINVLFFSRGSRRSAFLEIQLIFLKFARSIEKGIAYLSNKCFVHRDLAARNVLLDNSLTCKNVVKEPLLQNSQFNL